jgi:outer membrane biosynthesis protein TonB
MPASETPTNPTQAEKPNETTDQSSFGASPEPASGASQDHAPILLGRSSSRYVDYDTHELLEKISQYEDERRWQRIREGIWISLLAHICFFALLYFIPRYVFHQTQLIDPIQAIKDRKDLTYLDELPDALKQIQKIKPKLPALKPNETQVDKKTLEALKSLEKARPKPTPPAPEPQQQAENNPPPQPVNQPAQQPQQTPAPPSIATPQPNPQVALDTPRPAPVPARPNFSINNQNPADQLRQAMRDSARNNGGLPDVRGGAPSKDAKGGAGAKILSDTQGVNFDPWMQKLVRETYRTWDPLIPDEVLPPINKRGQVAIVFTVLPNGRLQPQSMTLVGRSGDVALDRAAWGAIEGADYPQLPREFHGPYIQIELTFVY